MPTLSYHSSTRTPLPTPELHPPTALTQVNAPTAHPQLKTSLLQSSQHLQGAFWSPTAQHVYCNRANIFKAPTAQGAYCPPTAQHVTAAIEPTSSGRLLPTHSSARLLQSSQHLHGAVLPRRPPPVSQTNSTRILGDDTGVYRPKLASLRRTKGLSIVL